MSDLKKYIEKRKATNPEFAEGFDEGFDEGYENFRIGIMLKQARLEAGLTQDEVASAIGTRKTAISRLENHVQDVKLSTVEKYVKALGKRIEIKIA
jgi:DNA-binding XRE family transcriptional regulator